MRVRFTYIVLSICLGWRLSLGHQYLQDLNYEALGQRSMQVLQKAEWFWSSITIDFLLVHECELQKNKFEHQP